MRQRALLAGTLLVAMLGASIPRAAAATTSPAFGTTKSTVSTDQYHLHGSDGVNWEALNKQGGKAMTLSLTPPVDAEVVITANLDLWTADAGYNQDIAIFVKGELAGWKESGGFAGTFSPNAAALQVAVPMTANATYPIELRWKTNRPAPGATIFAGAGPLPAGSASFSPTRLTLFWQPAASALIASNASNEQYTLHGSDGVTWKPMVDSRGLQLGAGLTTPSGTPTDVFAFANVDLFTADAGINQDISLGGQGNWKESGGSAGTFSPNAATLQMHYTESSGSAGATLFWKMNKNAPDATIYAGAGPLGSTPSYSPSRITVIAFPHPITTYGYPSETIQNSLKNSDGASFVPLWTDPNAQVRTWVETSVPCRVILTANADLWTSTAGYNQDLAIYQTEFNGVSNEHLLAWKESGGFAGTNSPNAAFVQAVVDVLPGDTTFALRWKTNRDARGSGAAIWAGAGPYPPGGGWTDYSATSLFTQLTDC